MKIEKILNNNVVIVKDQNQQDKIVMGKGIAFRKKPGDEFPDEMVDKEFVLSNKETLSKFQELIVDIPVAHVQLAEDIISLAKTMLGKNLNDMIYISLVDHVYTSIVRFLDGISVKNVLLWDIRRFYPDEYKIGMQALNMIEERFKTRLPEDEAGFIALHLVNAELDETSMQDMYQITRIIQEISNVVKYKFNVNFDENSVYYYRFIMHLRFFAQRLVMRKTYRETDDDLLEIIKSKYQNAYACVEQIAGFIKRKYDYDLSNEEKLYLTIHIERVIYKTEN